jgi:hypothetical protein
VTRSGVFTQGRAVTLSATPDSGSAFPCWSGGGCVATWSLTASADTTVRAVFARKPVTLMVHTHGAGTVTSRLSGIDCSRRCRFAFAPGAVRLASKPSAGWHFVGWQGACHGAKPTCRLDLERPGSAAAVFSKARPKK